MKDQEVGLTRDAGWQIGVRRTLPIHRDLLWEFLVSPRGISLWLGEGPPFALEEGIRYRLDDGTKGEVRVVRPGSHWRITRKPPDAAYGRPSTLQVRVLDSKGKGVLAFHEEHLPSENERQRRKAFYLEVVQRVRGELGI